MSMLTQNTPVTSKPFDPFVYRMLAGMVLGIATLNAGFLINMRFQRIPNLQRVIESVKLDSIGRGGEFLIEGPFQVLANSIAMLALGFSIAALWKLGRSQIVAAYFLSFVAIGTTVAMEITITRVWTRVLAKLLQ